MLRSWFRRSGAAMLSAAAMVLAGVTCTERLPTDAGRGGVARVGVVPQFTRDAAEVVGRLASLALTLDNIRIRLLHADGSVAIDTVVTITADQDSVVLILPVTLNTSTELLAATIEIRSGTTVLFTGTQSITAVGGTTSSSPPAEIPMTYSGPGAAATTFTVSPKDSTMKSVDSLVFRATAQNAANQPVTGLLMEWRTNPLLGLGVVSQLGVFKPVGATTRGSVYVVATLPTGLKDSALINIMPQPTAVAATPVTLSGTVGAALANPVVFTVRAADSLPVAGVTLDFTTSSGSVAPTSAVTNAAGQASTVFTLGPAVGTQTITATVAGIPTVTASKNVTAVAGAAAKLVVTTRPLASVASGASFSPSPQIRVADAFGNTITGSTAAVTVSAPVAFTLLGSATVNAVGGLATFSTLGIAGLSGPVLLTFSSGALATDTATATVQIGAPASFAAVTSTALTDSIDANLAPASVPGVLVKDAGNNPVPNIAVKFRRLGGAGSLINGGAVAEVIVNTGSDGKAALLSRRLQSALGVDSVLASIIGLTDTLRFRATVIHGKGDHLIFSTQPPPTGQAVSDLPTTALIQDRSNNPVETFTGTPPTVTLSIKPGTGDPAAILGPDAAALNKQAIAGGFAIFHPRIDKVGTGYKFVASSPGLVSAESDPFNVTFGAVNFVQVVSGDGQGAIKNTVLQDTIIVILKDAGMNAVPGVAPNFTVGGGGTIDSTVVPPATTDANGRIWRRWMVGTTGSQTLTIAKDVGTVTFNAYLAQKLIVVTQPPLQPVNGVPFPSLQQPTVKLTDVLGNPAKVAGLDINATTQIDPPQDISSILSGITTVTTNANGEAQFTDLSITGTVLEPAPHTVKLKFKHLTEIPFIDSTFSQTMTLQPGAATHLVFSAWPASVGALGTFSVTVKAKDIGGLTATSFTGSVGIALGNNPSEGTLSGVTPRNAVNGIATFNDLSINNSGSSYTIVAGAAGVDSAQTGPIDVIFPSLMSAIATSPWSDLGTQFACGRDIELGIHCWGANTGGEIGRPLPIGGDCIANILEDGYDHCPKPMLVPGLPGTSTFVVGDAFACALADGGVTWCWGPGAGNLNPTPGPAQVDISQSFSSLAAGSNHACGIQLSTNLAWCWGVNVDGRLGDGTTDDATTPKAVSGELTFTKLAAGTFNTCGLTGGSAYCWGDNTFGQLGDPLFEDPFSSVPRQVSGVTYLDITVGNTHACYLDFNWKVYCWGSNVVGEIGDNTSNNSRTTPTLVSGGRQYTAVSAGAQHTCAIERVTNDAYCWGLNNLGQLGDSTINDRLTPTKVRGGIQWASITAGMFFTCGVSTSNIAYCWGGNVYGNLGSGHTLVTQGLSVIPHAVAPPGSPACCAVRAVPRVKR